MEHMAITIELWNQKGGVGKSTFTVTLGVGLAAMGYSVTLMDTDSQGNMSRALKNLTDKRGQPRDGIFNLLTNEVPVKELLLPVSPEQYQLALPSDMPHRMDEPGELFVLPSYQKTVTAAVDLQLRGKFYNALAKAIEPLRESMDFLLIDTPPSASLLTPSVLHIADYVLIPTLLERWGLDGIAEVYQVMADSVELHHAEVLGIIPNRTRLTTLEHKDRKDELLAQYDTLVWEEIPESIVWSEAVDAQKSIFEYVPTHAASLAAVKLLKKFSEEVFARV